MFLVPEAGFSFIRYVNLPVPLSKRFQIGKTFGLMEAVDAGMVMHGILTNGGKFVTYINPNKKELDMNFIW